MSHSFSKVVLYVEDDPDDRFFMERVFKRAAVKTKLVCAPDGESAMAYLSGSGGFGDRATHPQADLVLLDLNMPGHSGFEVLSWARTTAGLVELPILVLSSSSNADDRTRAASLGATDYIVKPGNIHELTTLITSLQTRWFNS